MTTASAYRFDFDAIKRAVSMDELLAFAPIAGLKQKSPRQWKGSCPFCHGVDCFVVSRDGGRDKTGAFNCFKCPAGGDQIELLSMLRGHPRKSSEGVFAAAKELHGKFLGGGAADDASNRSNASPQPRTEKRHGFDPEAYAKTLDPTHEALAGLGVDLETLRAWKAGYASSGVNRGRLALAVVGTDGSIVGFVGRAVKDESPTLSFPNGFDPQLHIFGADRVVAGPVTLVRDPLAVLRASEAGCENVVAFLTEEITPVQLERLAALMDERQCPTLCFY